MIFKYKFKKHGKMNVHIITYAGLLCEWITMRNIFWCNASDVDGCIHTYIVYMCVCVFAGFYRCVPIECKRNVLFNSQIYGMAQTTKGSNNTPLNSRIYFDFCVGGFMNLRWIGSTTTTTKTKQNTFYVLNYERTNYVLNAITVKKPKLLHLDTQACSLI